jgi:hypothetical protein
MRSILVDWLVEVHFKFKLLPETLFIAVNLIDRYLEKEQIERKKFQLLGTTCLMVASKYEEIYGPEIKDFVYITDKAYSKEEFLDMEYKVLIALDFNVNCPRPWIFLERFAKLMKGDNILFNLARYFIEMSLIDS